MSLGDAVDRRHVLQILAALGFGGAAAAELAAQATPAVTGRHAPERRDAAGRRTSTPRGSASPVAPCSAISIRCRSCASSTSTTRSSRPPSSSPGGSAMAVAPDVLFLSAREQSALIRARKLSPVELTDAYLARIEQLNPRTNAFITVTADLARRQAAAAEREILRGRVRGPLHGIPYAPKDILATRGVLTTNGSKVTATVVPDYESTITDRLAEAGAVLAGKLNLLEFAMGSGVVSGFGPARNPWDLARTPSGSSSGSGSALAAAMVPLSVGTDTGGSIRGPANFCGIVGLKQTYGRVSRYGVTTLAWSLDHAGR